MHGDRMDRIVVIAATMRELRGLLTATSAEPVAFPGVAAHAATINGRSVIFAETGLGKANTAFCTGLLLHCFHPELVLNVGCGGAYPDSGLGVGDIAVADAEVYGDEGVLTPGGWESLELIGIPLWKNGDVAYYNTFPAAVRAADDALALAGTAGLTARRGTFLTVSTCSGTDERGRELASRFNAICENMEGAAAAHGATRLGVPFCEVRGISNLVEDRDLSRWDLDRAITAANTVALALLTAWTAER